MELVDEMAVIIIIWPECPVSHSLIKQCGFGRMTGRRLDFWPLVSAA